MQDSQSELAALRETVNALQERLDEEQERRTELEEELAAERERREELETEVEDLRDSVDSRAWMKDTLWDIEDVLDEGGSMAASTVAEDRGTVHDRLDALERDAVDPQDVLSTSGPDPEDLLPIQQLYNSVSAGHESPSGNKRRAAKLWPHFGPYADPSGGKMTLSSGQVRKIFDRELADEADNPNPNTVKRSMRFLAEFSDGLIDFDTDRKVNTLVADRDEWVERTNEMLDAVGEATAEQPAAGEPSAGSASLDDSVEEELDQLSEAGPIARADGGDGTE